MAYTNGHPCYCPLRIFGMPPLRNASYASERTCTVHQVLVASQKEGGDPGTYPAALLDAALTPK